MPAYHSIPQDVLFFRDGRPMVAGAGSGGHGARWPEPSLVFDAIHAALHRAFGSAPESWEHPHATGRNGHYTNPQNKNQRFGSLITAGFFPAIGAEAGSSW